MRAAWLGDEAGVARLLAAGADEGDVGEYHKRAASCLREALECAAQQGHEAVAARLIAAGAEKYTHDDHGALYRPAWRGYDAVVARLLASGANVHVNVDEALRSASGNGHI